MATIKDPPTVWFRVVTYDHCCFMEAVEVESFTDKSVRVDGMSRRREVDGVQYIQDFAAAKSYLLAEHEKILTSHRKRLEKLEQSYKRNIGTTEDGLVASLREDQRVRRLPIKLELDDFEE
jgi:hypothetical protein